MKRKISKVREKLKNAFKRLPDPALNHSTKISRILFSSVLVITGVCAVVRFSDFSKSEGVSECSVLEQLVGTNGEWSYGYNHGLVYSLDGNQISEYIVIGEETRHCAVYGFSSIIGAQGSSGLIYACDETLRSSAHKENKNARTGNNIITTLSYRGQLKAAELLKDAFTEENCDGACISVVLKDGAVLVAAGSNEYDLGEVLSQSEIPKNLFVDLTALSMPVGSVAKAITARMLLLKDDQLSDEDSIYNKNYVDFSFYNSNGTRISNWDVNIPGNYETLLPESGAMVRYVSLADALRLSSNTYFWRHAMALGLDKAYLNENELFGIFSPISTEINQLKDISVEEDRLDYFFWGQDFSVAPVRLCELYNHVLSGEAYTPFYVASVRLPDNTELYRAAPHKREELSFDVPENDILKDGLSECFKSYSQNIDSNITVKYQDLIDDKRLLAKSGTADKDIEKGTTNNTRVLTVLNEKHEVIATACILVENAKQNTITDNLLFSMLFETLEAADVI